MPPKREIVRATPEQINRMIDYMAAHPLFAANQYLTALGPESVGEQWDRLKEMLSNYGPDRSVDQWKHTWRDQRKKAKEDGGRVRRALNATGNAVDVPELQASTAKILGAIGKECAIGLAVEGETGVGSFVYPVAEIEKRGAQRQQDDDDDQLVEVYVVDESLSPPPPTRTPSTTQVRPPRPERTPTPTFTRTQAPTPTFHRPQAPTPTFTRPQAPTPTFHRPQAPTPTFTRPQAPTPTFPRPRAPTPARPRPQAPTPARSRPATAPARAARRRTLPQTHATEFIQAQNQTNAVLQGIVNELRCISRQQRRGIKGPLNNLKF